MNANEGQSNQAKVQRANVRAEWGLMLGLLLAAALVLMLAGRGVPGQAASPAPNAMNNHLYVPCSVGGCPTTRPVVMNNHLYVPCSVMGCPATRPAVINNHLYVPCSVSGCPPIRPA